MHANLSKPECCVAIYDNVSNHWRFTLMLQMILCCHLFLHWCFPCLCLILTRAWIGCFRHHTAITAPGRPRATALARKVRAVGYRVIVWSAFCNLYDKSTYATIITANVNAWACAIERFAANFWGISQLVFVTFKKFAGRFDCFALVGIITWAQTADPWF